MHEEPAAQNEVSLREYLDLLRRRKAIIISTFIADCIYRRRGYSDFTSSLSQHGTLAGFANQSR